MRPATKEEHQAANYFLILSKTEVKAIFPAHHEISRMQLNDALAKKCDYDMHEGADFRYESFIYEGKSYVFRYDRYMKYTECFIEE